MPYHLLQSILGVTFLAVWCFIAVTFFADRLSEARAKRLEESACGPHFRRRRRRGRRRRRIAAQH